MNKFSCYFLSFSFWTISFAGFGQETTLTPKELKHDFEILRGALEEMHPGLYWYSTKEEMDTVFEGIRSSLNSEMTDLEFFRLLSKAISKIRCGHTWIAPSELTTKKLLEEGPLLPLEIKLIAGKAYFFHNNSEQQLAIRPGQEILQVNGYSIDSLVELSYQVHSGDGWTTTGKAQIFERYFNFFYVIHIDQPEKYELTYLDELGEPQIMKVKAIPSAEFNKRSNSESHDANIQIRFIDNHTALLAVRAFDNWKEDGRRKKFLKELQKAFFKVDSAKTNNLIMDIRNNGGGTERYGLILCSYFTDEPFFGYQQIRFKNTKFRYRKYSKTSGFESLIYRTLLHHKKVNDTTYLLKNDNNLNLVKVSKPHFSGNTYMLINGGTYSTAADFSALMHSKGLATFIGKETGGGYRGNSSDYEFEFVLPNSKIRFNAPLAQYLTNVEYTSDNYGRGTIPDHKVQPTIENLVSRVDTELDYTLDLIKNN